MAPEQALGNHAAVDARTDVFALGAMVYEMLCGAPAFAGASVPEVVFKVVYEEPPPLASRVPGLPAHVTAAVHRALAKKADERFPDVASFVEALTGQPLTTGKRPLVIPQAPAAEGEKAEKISNREAFAQTVGSGDHAQSLGIQATVASGRHEPQAAAPAPEPPARRGKTGAIVAVVALLAAGGIAAAVVMSGGGESPPKAAAAPDAGAIAKVETADAAPAVTPPAPVDASAAVAAPPDAAAKKPPPKEKDPPREKDPDPEPEPAGGDEEPAALRTELKACTQLLDDDPDEAMRCANLILEKHPNTRAVHAIRAKAYCANGDQEKAISALRRLGRGRLRKQVIAYCAREGVTLQ
jgi:serine/threonine-protein kinase